jgi:hypothetical protein
MNTSVLNRKGENNMAGELVTTNFDTGGVVMGNNEYEDGLLKFPGADTYVAGTILARDPLDETWVVCDPDESDGTEIPSAILTIETVATLASNVSIRGMISGKVRLDKLVYDGGHAVDIATVDALRSFGILAVDVDEVGVLDNQ